MQKKVGDVLYVLDLTPYEITEDTDVSIIYVQNEKMKEYKELNTELASKMHGFNQFIMAVQPLPWSDGGDDPEPEPTGHTLTLDGNDIHSHVDVYFNNEQVQTTTEYFNVAAGTEIQIKPEQGASQSWYSVIQGVEWDDNVQAWVATMPDEDYRITINYGSRPQVEAYWGYTNLYGNQQRWENQYFVKSPRVFTAIEDPEHAFTTLWLYPVDENADAISINSDEGITVSSITSSNPLVTFNSSDGKPIVSRDSNDELPYGDVTITATIHDNSGTYADRTISYTLRLVNNTHVIVMIDDGDPLSVISENDYIKGGYELGMRMHRMLRYSYSRIYIDGDPVEYLISDDEFNTVGFPVGAKVRFWFDGNAEDLDITYAVGGDPEVEVIDDKQSGFIEITIPEENPDDPFPYDSVQIRQAVWNTPVNNKIAFNDTVASHSGSNIDDHGFRYYYVLYYESAPDTYRNTIYYGYNDEENQYGPSDFVFSVTNGQGQSVQLTDIGDGSYSFSMDSNGNPDTFTINVYDPSQA